MERSAISVLVMALLTGSFTLLAPQLSCAETGWCCRDGALTSTTRNACIDAGGSFVAEPHEAAVECGSSTPSRGGGTPAPGVTVTTTADRPTECRTGGACSLRGALDWAAAHPGPEAITFSLSIDDPGYDDSRGAWVFRFASPLPALKGDGNTIDGTSIKSPKAPSLPHAVTGCPRPAVELDGAGLDVGLLVQGHHNTVTGLSIYSFNGPGLRIEGNGNAVMCCYLGTDIVQRADLGNVNGVALRGSSNNNRIGVPGNGNVISGNRTNGVLVGPGSTNTAIEGNLIGVKGDGETALPNRNGIALEPGSQHTLVGGDGNRSPAWCDRSCNVISGNTGHGVQVVRSDTNLVVANFIGVSADGTKAVGNRDAGVWMLGSRHNRVGGGLPGLGNVISGNRDGVVIQGVADRKPWDNKIEGNLIGTDAHGTGPLPNTGRGVLITVGADKNVVGGSPNQGNVIAGNRLAGVRIDRASSLNHVTNNWIGTTREGRLLGNGQGVALYSGARLNWVGGEAGKGNVIAYNNGDGVHVEGQQTIDNGVASNSIHSNLGKGISLVDGGNGTQRQLRIWRTDLIDAATNTYYVVGEIFPHEVNDPGCRVAIYTDDADEGRWIANPLVVTPMPQDPLRIGWFGASAILKGNRFTFTMSDELGHNTSEFLSADIKAAAQGTLPFDMDYWEVDPDNRIPLNPHYHGGWGIFPPNKDVTKLWKPWSWPVVGDILAGIIDRDRRSYIECGEDAVNPSSVSQLRGFLCGWFMTYRQVVMFDGDLYWETFMDEGTPGFEDIDNNFGMWTPGFAGVHLNSQRYLDPRETSVHERLRCPGDSVCDARDWEDKLGGSFHIGHWVEQTRYFPLLTLEVDRSETFDNWDKHPFWRHLQSDGSHLKGMFDGMRAKVIGRWAMDGYHYCRSEVHPVFGMAVREGTFTPGSGPGTEVWHFFMRRKGGQALCGGWASESRQDWHFRFEGREGTPTARISNLLSNNWAGGVQVSVTGPYDNGDVVVTMHLPDEDDRVCGTITITWN